MTDRRDSESSLFDVLEQSMETDLGSWRTALLEFFESHLPLIIQSISHVRGVPVDLTVPEDVKLVGATMREFILDRWKEIPGAPMEEDIINISGRGIYQVYQGESFDIELTNPTTRVSGAFTGFDLQPYMDSSYIDVIDKLEIAEGEEPDENLVRAYLKSFGLHLVLTNAIVTGEGYLEPDHVGDKLVYVPLHYPEMVLTAISAE